MAPSTAKEAAMTAPSVSVGTRCYIPDAEAAWLPVYVEAVDEAARTVTVRVQRQREAGQDCGDHDEDDCSGEAREVAIDVGFPLQNAQLSLCASGLDNMIELNHLHEAAILRNLTKRFRARRPYTYTGDICLAVNPYQWLDELYAPGLHAQYLRASSRQEMPPHVYAVSVAAYRHMQENGSNQSILVSGESGAGKTETTKILMDNLATIAAAPAAKPHDENQTPITTRIIQVNPLLESFGNAKTTRNDNSSRFGKFTQLQFDARHALCGAQCETYLLEKTRVISHEQGERNYHIFYQLLHGPTPEERDALGLGDDCPNFVYLQEQQPQPKTRPGHRQPAAHAPVARKPALATPEEQERDRAHFAKTKQALALLGLDADKQNDLFQVLAGVLHLGEATFEADAENDEASHLVLDSVAYSSVLLGLEASAMDTALCHRTMKAAGEVYAVPLTAEQARSGRDALAKAIYANVFEWLVAGINASLGAAPRVTQHTIGVLDIFGFESFEHNSFEQLCINYANEKLQHKFTQDVFKAVQDEYEREHITWAHIAYADNTPTLALLEGRMGVLALLNEEVVRPRGNAEGFVSKLAGAYRQSKTLVEFPRISRTQFAIHHYAATVTYEATGFLEKHKDALLADLSSLLCGSRDPFTRMLFLAKAQEAEAAAARASSGSGRKLGSGRGASGGTAADKTVGMQFKQSLNALMATINDTNVNYVRCIKPNSVKSATHMDGSMVATQLRCAGVIEAVCIARAGYPNRLPHAEFAAQFELFLTDSEQLEQQEDSERFGAAHCRSLAKRFELETPEEFQLGSTKIYLQKGVLERLEQAKAHKLFAYAACIQARWRGIQARREYCERRAALLVLQRRAKVFVAVRRLERVKHAVATLQRVWRGHVGRQVFLAVLREHRAVQIQRTWRGRKGREIFFAVLCHSRALRLQCCARQYLARKELHVRRVEWERQQAALAAEERERRRQQEEERARREAEERERLRQLEAERARREAEEQERLRVLEEERERQESAVVVQRNVRGYFARCLVAEMLAEAEEQERLRLEHEAEKERLRLQQERDEREAAAREKKRQAEERKRLAIQMRQRREAAVGLLQRVTRGHQARCRVAALREQETARREQEAATRLQSVQRGRLARQKFSTFQLEAARDEEIERVRQENELLKRQLEQLLAAKSELEAEVDEVRCDRDVLQASNKLRELELTQQLNAQKKELDEARGQYSTLCDDLEKTSSRSTEPEELHSSSGTSDSDEDVGPWDDRPSLESSTPSYFDGDRPSTDLSQYLDRARGGGTRASRLTNTLQQRRQQASAAVSQRRSQAATRLQSGATTITRAKKWMSLPKRGKKSKTVDEPHTPTEPAPSPVNDL